MVSESGERNTSLMGQDVLKIFDSGFQVLTLDGLSSFVGVLEMDSKITSGGLDSYKSNVRRTE